MDGKQSIPTMFVTHLPFWNNRTGAEQRVLSMVKFFSSQGHAVETVYGGRLSDADREKIGALDLTVHAVFDDPVPANVIERVGWEIRCILNWLAIRLKVRNPVSQSVAVERGIGDFKDATLARFFRRHAQKIKPQLIVVVYASHAWIVEHLPAELSNQCVLAIDTQDVLHQRCRQFSDRGDKHWIQVSEAEETAALNRFDLIIAIQDEEAAEFQRMLPDANVQTVSHAVEVDPIELKKLSGDPVTIGFFGSANAPNVEGINRFIQQAWPSIMSRLESRVRLLVAGGVCDRLDHLSCENVQLLGFVEDPRAFYEQVDIVINPVTFGTGLKIKNLEALGFGKSLVTTSESAKGLPQSDTEAFVVAEFTVNKSEQFIDSVCRFATDADERLQLGEAAKQYAIDQFSPEAVYGPLIERVKVLLSRTY